MIKQLFENKLFQLQYWYFNISFPFHLHCKLYLQSLNKKKQIKRIAWINYDMCWPDNLLKWLFLRLAINICSLLTKVKIPYKNKPWRSSQSKYKAQSQGRIRGYGSGAFPLLVGKWNMKQIFFVSGLNFWNHNLSRSSKYLNISQLYEPRTSARFCLGPRI